MKRWLYSYRRVSGGAGGRLRVHLPAQVLGAEVTKAVRVTTGVATLRGPRLVIPVAWQADPARHAFPTFSGTIELAPLDYSSGQLTVVGSYRVPAGVVGLLADSTVLRGVAERTAQRILDGVADALTTPAAQEPVSSVAPSTPLQEVP